MPSGKKGHQIHSGAFGSLLEISQLAMTSYASTFVEWAVYCFHMINEITVKKHYLSSSNCSSPVPQVFTPQVSPGDMLLEFTVFSLHGSYLFL